MPDGPAKKINIINALWALILMVGNLWAVSMAAAAAAQPTPDPLSLYGPRLEFSVYRNDVPVGRHVVTFRQDKDQLIVDNRFDVKISFLGIPVFNYLYESEGFWESGKLQSINIKLDDDGKKSEIKGRRLPLSFDANGETIPLGKNAEIYPTNHWNSGVLKESELFNTLTGKMNKVTITKAGEETVDVRGGTVRASRYIYSGELNVVAWYDADGRWVKLKFKAEDNSDMEYVCETCLLQIGKSE